MSVLLTGLEEELTETLARRLVSQADEVRIILGDDACRERWRTLGLHVAVGDLTDDDFLWRACTNVRTVVAGDGRPADAPEVRESLPSLLGKTDVDRLVVVGPAEDDALVGSLRDADMDHVILRFRKRGLLGSRRGVATADLAAAIDAADDLAGEPRLDLDLLDAGSWTQLRLPAPS